MRGDDDTFPGGIELGPAGPAEDLRGGKLVVEGSTVARGRSAMAAWECAGAG